MAIHIHVHFCVQVHVYVHFHIHVQFEFMFIHLCVHVCISAQCAQVHQVPLLGIQGMCSYVVLLTTLTTTCFVLCVRQGQSLSTLIHS